MPLVMLLVFALTLFVSASLLFLVQPLVGKLLLPYMGGTPAVWNTCMVFFQALLLAGYGYAHGLGRIQSPRRQLLIHAIVLALPVLPLFLLRFDVGTIATNVWSPPSESNPIPWLLTVLLLTAGLPFFVVSTSAPLLQKWFSGTSHPDAKDPYFLYGASNVGSMGALLLYPALIEPNLYLQSQTLYWALGYVVLALMILVCGWLGLSYRQEMPPMVATESQTQTTDPVDAPSQGPGRDPNLFDRIRWVLLAFVPSSVMIGCTTHLTTDIAAVPLLWILPLTVYLASYIFVFSRLPLWLSLSVGLLLPVLLVGWLVSTGLDVSIPNSGTSDLFKGKWAYAYHYCQQLFNTSFDQFNLRHLLTVAVLGILIGTCFHSPQSIHTLMVVLAPLAGLAIAFEGELQRFFALKESERILLHVAVLFVVAMVCHGELARTRPTPSHLTEFYLLMSLGGVLGGMLNTLLAPQVFDRVVEYPFMVAVMLLLMPWPGSSDDRGWARTDSWLVVSFGTVVGIFLAVLFLARVYIQADTANKWVEKNVPTRLRPLGHFLAGQLAGEERVETTKTGWTYQIKIIKRERNFFGTFTVASETWTSPRGWVEVYHKMFHGSTIHGVQCMSVTTPDGTTSEAKRAEALSYFSKQGPIGDLFESRYRLNRPLKVAILGVGTGTLAAYAKPGWEVTLYEIDPVVVQVARDPAYFTFLSDAEARGVKVNVVLGDGRQEFKKAEDGTYDLIFMDAFTSDAVPIHLMTREATNQIYRKKLAPGGILIFNIANRYLTFEEILGNLCSDLSLKGIVSYGDDNRDEEIYAGSWVLIAEKEENFGMLPYIVNEEAEDLSAPRWTELPTKPSLGVWTDDYANLLSVFRWSR